MAGLSYFLIPAQDSEGDIAGEPKSSAAKFKNLDMIGVGMLTGIPLLLKLTRRHHADYALDSA
jgi:hypothetical protein